jgi:hypothetical protein
VARIWERLTGSTAGKLVLAFLAIGAVAGLAAVLTGGHSNRASVNGQSSGSNDTVGSQPISYWEESLKSDQVKEQMANNDPYRTESVDCVKQDSQHLLCTAHYSDGDSVVHRLTVDDQDHGKWTSIGLTSSQAQTPTPQVSPPTVNGYGCPPSAPYPQSSVPGNCATQPAYP